MGIRARVATWLFAVSALVLAAGSAQATIISSKHDLRTGPGVELCVFCHTPHNASTQEGLKDAPLWNRKITNLNAFTPYSSPTMTQTCPTRPSPISLACLSCHDGTGASSAVFGGDQHNVLNKAIAGAQPLSQMDGARCEACHTGTAKDGIHSSALTEMAGPDLSNDHPISMPFPPAANTNYNTPPDAQKGWADIKLYQGRVECASCHNAHDPTNTPFLRKTNSNSTLCLTCHAK